MADQLKETAKQELEQIKNVASEGVRSGAYVYPIKASLFMQHSYHQIIKLTIRPRASSISLLTKNSANHSSLASSQLLASAPA